MSIPFHSFVPLVPCSPIVNGMTMMSNFFRSDTIAPDPRLRIRDSPLFVVVLSFFSRVDQLLCSNTCCIEAHCSKAALLSNSSNTSCSHGFLGTIVTKSYTSTNCSAITAYTPSSTVGDRWQTQSSCKAFMYSRHRSKR